MMLVSSRSVDYWEIAELPTKDPVGVYWDDIALNKGRITITCEGISWTAYFGAMSRESIKHFVLACDTSYLVDKLSRPKQTRKEALSLMEIVKYLKQAINERIQ